MRLLRSLPLALAWSTLSLAQDIVKESSFGADGKISQNSFAIPGWSMLGEGSVPSLLSDKVILTPPYGDNKRGAVWTENKNNLAEWLVDFEFRAGGQERGSGNLQLWYVNEGEKTLSTRSIYTAGKFDGLAIVIDTNAGEQKIRGFLNDGTTDYRSHPNVDSLAFGHCTYTYRNLGRPSRLAVKATKSGLEVAIDERPCFSTPAVSLPTSYNFGVTAASGSPPDSIEAFRFVLRPATGSSIPPPASNQQPQQILNDVHGNMPTQPNDAPASQFTTSAAQFEDLHNRLTLLSKSITNLFAEMQRHKEAEEQHYNDLRSRLSSSSPPSSSNNNPASLPPDLSNRLTKMEKVLDYLSQEITTSDHKTQFAALSAQLTQTHLGMTEHLPNRLREYVAEHTPRVGFIVFSFMAFQSLLVMAYVLYKRRRLAAPKKYL